jgi:hypothetical protein
MIGCQRTMKPLMGYARKVCWNVGSASQGPGGTVVWSWFGSGLTIQPSWGACARLIIRTLCLVLNIPSVLPARAALTIARGAKQTQAPQLGLWQPTARGDRVGTAMVDQTQRWFRSRPGSASDRSEKATFRWQYEADEAGWRRVETSSVLRGACVKR